MVRKVFVHACRLLSVAALLVLAVLAVIYIAALIHRQSGAGAVDPALSRVDFVTIILTAVTVILAALGITLAVAGAVGYATIRDAAIRAAREEAREVAAKVAEREATKVARGLEQQMLATGDTGADAIMRAEGEQSERDSANS